MFCVWNGGRGRGLIHCAYLEDKLSYRIIYLMNGGLPPTSGSFSQTEYLSEAFFSTAPEMS